MTTIQPVLATPRLQLLPAHIGLARPMLDYQVRNRQHFAAWDPKPGDMFFTELYWTMQLRQQALSWEQGRGARFLLTRPEQPRQIIGTVSLSNIVRGVFQAAHLGYGIDHSLQGQGLMHEAVSEIIRFAFDDLRLHRLQANYQPHNQRSAALLQRLGFVEEGLARDYLYINGAWRDHVLTSLTNPQFDPARMLA
ncbi:GNAT family N-acetyltransferase [Aquitalea magnusonii]|uniref:[SSU ribosomal protein S5P]-alanine acetyltransferase n=1 Tax=Aquitalea magnusonii TaxID=332411 RepID=A0A318JIK3_9NEIS|nr:GNAT family N-acetyltransferase [Aquitalea magnusonii]PXX49902.1 [SSU ribosomal protein S5P]-alanine acetyltransferase [Aquitalea magnusonii]